MDERKATEAPGIMDRETSVRKCAEITRINYGWLLDQVNRGLNPPKRYRRPGFKQWRVKPREVQEWYDRLTAG